MEGGYKYLLDVGLRTQCPFTQTVRIGGHGAQVHQLQPLALHLLYYDTENLLLFNTVLWQKYQSRTVFTLLRHWDTLQKDELVRYLNHYTCTVAVFTYLGTTMAHVFEYTQCIVNQLVTLATVDVDNHSNTTGIVLILVLVKSLFLKFTLCHIILYFR